MITKEQWKGGHGYMVPPTCLRHWEKGIEMRKDLLNTIPKFRAPLLAQTDPGMHCQGSAQLVYLYLDKQTQDALKVGGLVELSDVRICMEVNAPDILPPSVDVDLENGDLELV